MAHDVFISYSSHDKPAADAICAKLESRRIRCWIAPRDIPPGAGWGGAIIDSLDASRVMLLLFSASANKSPQIKREVERAVHKEIVIVPVRVEDVMPTGDFEYFLGTPHWLDAITPPFAQHLESVADSVAFWLRAGTSDGAVAGVTGVPPAIQSGRKTDVAAGEKAIANVRRIGLAMMGVIAIVATILGIRSYLAYRNRQTLANADLVVDGLAHQVMLGTAPDLLKAPDRTAVDTIRASALARDPAAERRLGFLYRYGLGLAKNDGEAFAWTGKAAAAGDSPAQNDLGVIYRDGLGITADNAEALRWFRMAAAQNYPPALANLGRTYLYGISVEEDDAEALEWLRKGADAGDPSAQNYLGWMNAGGHGAFKDDAQAISWYRKAAAQDFAVAEANLGKCYEKGEGVDKNYPEAVRWYRKAAEHGNGWAESNLGAMYENGWGVDRDLGQALQWYEKGAAHGEREAIENLQRLRAPK